MAYYDLDCSEIATLRAESDLLIFDTRDANSYARGHLDGAQPVSDAALKQLMKSRERARPVLVYCYRGNSSRDICQFIAGMGYSRVYNLSGGWQAWEHFNQPTSKALQTSPALAVWLSQHGFPADNIHARADNGMSPLMLAALKGERALVEELLAQSQP